MKNFKRLASVIVVAALMLAVIPFTASAAVSNWDGSISTSFEKGTGTETDPYIIASAGQLAFLASSTNENADGKGYEGVFFKLDTDVNLAGNPWEPIGKSSSAQFKGNFDGADHVITGMNCDMADSYSGLFGRVIGSTIKNVTVKGSLSRASKYAGGIAGMALDGSSIINCHTEIDLVDANGTSAAAGGIVGRSQFASGSKCTTYTIIVGCSSASNVGSVKEEVPENAFMGGILGVGGSTSVLYCENKGNVTSTAATKYSLAGGIVGCLGANKYNSNILFCKSSGNMVAYKECDATSAGGIVGRTGHVTGGYVVGNYSVAEAFTYQKGTTTLVEEGYGGILGQTRDYSSIFNNYTSQQPTFGIDTIGLSDDAAVYVEQNALEAVDVFEKINIGHTLADAAKLIARLGLEMSLYDYEEAEKFVVEGGDLYAYVAAELCKEYDGTKVLLDINPVAGLPEMASLENAVYVAVNFDEMVEKSTEIIDDVAKNQETENNTEESSGDVESNSAETPEDSGSENSTSENTEKILKNRLRNPLRNPEPKSRIRQTADAKAQS